MDEMGLVNEIIKILTQQGVQATTQETDTEIHIIIPKGAGAGSPEQAQAAAPAATPAAPQSPMAGPQEFGMGGGLPKSYKDRYKMK